MVSNCKSHTLLVGYEMVQSVLLGNSWAVSNNIKYPFMVKGNGYLPLSLSMMLHHIGVEGKGKISRTSHMCPFPV